jgi:hypothetical protein
MSMRRITWDHLPLGDLPRETGAVGEYHCVRGDRRYAGWTEPTNHWSWKQSNWRVAEEEGARVLRQRHRSRYNNTILISDAVARDVSEAEVEVCCEDTSGEVGLVFAFRTALDYLCLHLERDRVKLSRRCGENFLLLAESEPVDAAGRWAKLAVRYRQDRVVCLLDDREILEAPVWGDIDGRVGLLANVPAKFRSLRGEGAAPQAAPRKALPGWPEMQLLRKIDVRGFGTNRQVRFGDLTGDGRLDILLAQPGLHRAEQTYPGIAALTAVDTDGRVLWQSGRPSAAAPMITCDLPFQVHDVDGDGRAEVVCVRNFEIEFLDGATGERKFACPVPDHPPPNALLEHVVTNFGSPTGADLPRPWINAVAFADLTGRGTPRDVLIKDHYHHLWAFTADMEPLWRFCGNIGHFPFAADLNGDGRDEVVAGYHTLDCRGRTLESLHFGDHADAVFAGDIQDWGQPRIIRAGGDDGFFITSFRGDLVVVHHGHVQRLGIGNFRPDHAGLEYVICTYWGAPGIVALIDSGGKLVWSRAYPVCGNTLQPVNWTGDGRELIYFSAHAAHGGLYDADGERVVPFPDDGHPELCSEVLDLLGTGRDNLIVWDTASLWVYGPAGDPCAGRRYAPLRPPLHNWSNYMAYWSIPRWEGG